MAEPSVEDQSLQRLVSEAAARITRLEPREAYEAARAGAVIIDIRSKDARTQAGVIPGSLHIPRTVLEWRVAVDSDHRSAYIGGTDQELIIICDHGYSSVLAASNLVQLGFSRTADVIGGYEAWKRERLPTVTGREHSSAPDGLPGMGPPE